VPGEAADVYQVGMIIMCLFFRWVILHTGGAARFIVNVQYYEDAVYTKLLAKTIALCLRKNPLERPTADSLVQVLQR
jgi:hypothetical protein